MKYIEAFKGWKGYSKSELIYGKYRPIFVGTGGIKKYNSPVIGGDAFNRRLKRDKVRVPATRENLAKTARFNIKYGDEPYQRWGRRELKRLGLK